MSSFVSGRWNKAWLGAINHALLSVGFEDGLKLKNPSKIVAIIELG
jgi:hypothetical protein